MLPELGTCFGNQQQNTVGAVAANLRQISVQLVIAKKDRGLKAAGVDPTCQQRPIDIGKFREMPLIFPCSTERSFRQLDLDDRSRPFIRLNQRIDVRSLMRVENSLEIDSAAFVLG